MPTSALQLGHLTWDAPAPFFAGAVKIVSVKCCTAGRSNVTLDEAAHVDGTWNASAGEVLAAHGASRGQKTNRDIVGDFELRAPSVVVTSGGIGGDFELVRKSWPTAHFDLRENYWRARGRK